MMRVSKARRSGSATFSLGLSAPGSLLFFGLVFIFFHPVDLPRNPTCSDWPWSAQAVFDPIQEDVCQRPEWVAGILTLDESRDKRAGSPSAGPPGNIWVEKGLS